MAFVCKYFDMTAIGLGALTEGGNIGQGGKPGDGKHVFVAFVGKRAGFDQGEIGIGVKAAAVLVKEAAAWSFRPELGRRGKFAVTQCQRFQLFFLGERHHRFVDVLRPGVRVAVLPTGFQSLNQRVLQEGHIRLGQFVRIALFAAGDHDAQGIEHLREVAALLIIAVGNFFIAALLQATAVVGLAQGFFGLKEGREGIGGGGVEGHAPYFLAHRFVVVGEQTEGVALVEDELARCVDCHAHQRHADHRRRFAGAGRTKDHLVGDTRAVALQKGIAHERLAAALVTKVAEVVRASPGAEEWQNRGELAEVGHARA